MFTVTKIQLAVTGDNRDMLLWLLVALYSSVIHHINVKNTAVYTNVNSDMYTVSQKETAKLFLSELCEISTSFDNFWPKDGKEAEIMRTALIFHLTQFASPHYHV